MNAWALCTCIYHEGNCSVAMKPIIKQPPPPNKKKQQQKTNPKPRIIDVN